MPPLFHQKKQYKIFPWLSIILAAPVAPFSFECCLTACRTCHGNLDLLSVEYRSSCRTSPQLLPDSFRFEMETFMFCGEYRSSCRVSPCCFRAAGLSSGQLCQARRNDKKKEGEGPAERRKTRKKPETSFQRTRKAKGQEAKSEQKKGKQGCFKCVFCCVSLFLSGGSAVSQVSCKVLVSKVSLQRFPFCLRSFQAVCS